MITRHQYAEGITTQLKKVKLFGIEKTAPLY